MKWYSVVEVLPGDLEEVLLLDTNQGRSLGYYHLEFEGFIRECDGLRLIHVTHWMPLPTNPEMS